MILIDGVFHEGTTAPFDYADRGFTLGDGLFETMLSLGGRVHRMADHLDRLQAGLELLGMALPRERLESDVHRMAARRGAAVLRLTVTRGSGARGLAPPAEPKPMVVVSSAPFDPGLVMRPVTLATAGARRNDRSPLSRLKALGYLDAILALREAVASGAGDALFLNTGNRIACSSVANIFRIAGDALETPPVSDGVLPGITRSRVLALAPSVGLRPAERSLEPVDLHDADGVFLTNSLRFLQPVTAIDGQALRSRANQDISALFAALCQEVTAETGVDPRST